MKIGGFQKFSLINYPGKMSAVIFLQGCNFRCPFCYNKELVYPECFAKPLDESSIMKFLYNHKEVLEAVVVTGGEPTIHQDLPAFFFKLKSMRYAVKLDTNGSNCRMLKHILRSRLIDYIAMDIKAPLEKYDSLIGGKGDTDSIRESIKLILNSRLEYEFRTTFVKPLLQKEDLPEIKNLISHSKRFRLQNFQPNESVLDQTLLNQEQLSEKEMCRLQKMTLSREERK